MKRIPSVIFLALFAGVSAFATSQVESTAGPMEIYWQPFTWPGHTVQADSYAQKVIEATFPVKIKVGKWDVFNEQQTRLALGSGDVPDFFSAMRVGGYEWLVDQKLIRPVSEARLRRLMPQWMKNIETFTDPNIVKLQITYKGDVWGIPWATVNTSATLLMAARKDWMDKVGVTQIPRTVDDLYVLMKKFTTDDPDGNGKNDTYGINPAAQFHYIFGAYIGAMPNTFYPVNGTIVYASISEGYKTVLKLLHKWYSEGIVDPEFVTDSYDTVKSKWSDGKTGTIEVGAWGLVPSVPGNITKMLKDKNPNAETVIIPPVTGPDGKSGGSGYLPTLMSGAPRFFGAKVPDAKVDMVMKIEERKVEDWNFAVKLRFGELGKQYNIVNGIIVPVPDLNTVEKIHEFGINDIFGLYPFTPVEEKKTMPPDDAAIFAVAYKAPAIRVNYDGHTSFVYSGVNEAAKTYQADLDTIFNEYYFNAITGKVDIDSTWDAYVAKWTNAGGEKVRAEYQQLYDEAMKALAK